MTYDVLIIGAGPAGMTSALYSARSGLRVGVISKDIGGTANSILLLENWPGFRGSGAHLMKQFYEQAREYKNIEFIMEDVKEIEKSGNNFIVKTRKKQLKSRTIILATGTERKKLGIPGEEKFTGKGVSYCITCDGFFFKNKTTAVIGGSDCAAISALSLADIAKKVYIIYRGEKLRCESIVSERLKKKKNVEIIYNAIPVEILGKDKVNGIKIFSKKSRKIIALDGIFVEIGAEPLNKSAQKLGLELDAEGYIVVCENMSASIEGIFAAGDITSGSLKQVVVASAQGAIAAKSVYEYIERRR